MFLNIITWNYHVYQSFAVSFFDFYTMIDFFFFEFLLDSTLIMNLCEILYNVASAALA